MDSQADDIKRKRFYWGAFLAWAPFLICILPAAVAVFHGVSSKKATGLGAVAGGISESLLIFGVVALLVLEVVAIVLLLRAFSKGHPLRVLLSVVSLCCSGFMLIIVGLFFWLFFFRLHPT